MKARATPSTIPCIRRSSPASTRRREKKQPGNINNLDTGKTVTWKGACVTRGATVGFDPRAREQAMKNVSDFLRA
jgi:hypothetical protein